MNGGLFLSMLLGVIIWFIIFFLLRKLLLWYFRVDEMVDLLRSIDKKLGKDKPNTTAPGSKAEAIGEYVSLKGKPGEAFCLGCRKTAPKNVLFYHKKTDSYYHRDCIPQNK